MGKFILIVAGSALTGMALDLELAQQIALNLGILFIGIGASQLGEPWS